MHIVLSRNGDAISAVELDDALEPTAQHAFAGDEWLAYVRGREAQSADRPRWVWDASWRWYPPLLAAGVRVERCIDLQLSHRILRASVFSAGSALAKAPPNAWDEAGADAAPAAAAAVTGPSAPTLFELVDDGPGAAGPQPGRDPARAGGARRAPDPVAEFLLQQQAIAGSAEASRLRLLIAAESAGALIAAEIRRAGLPWRADVHRALLAETLGERPPHGGHPSKLEALAAQVRGILNAPTLNLDSQPELLAALRRVGLNVTSTGKWQLRELEHEVIAPLLEYRQLYRLLTANGWAWLDEWVVDGRFRPEYVVGGVVTGRWASSGGGALQLPKNVRRAVQADPGWKLVVADAAQLEPRVLSGLAADRAMADAARGRDLYDAVVQAGVVDTRPHAKVAMLGAMYGATTGDSAQLMPRLRRAYPKAIALVDQAAADGERGEAVVSRLGRTSPRPSPRWHEVQQHASEPGASAADERRARSQARDWGRFTRNFVVQSTAAEWALCWMAEVRLGLARLTVDAGPADWESGPHLVYFLHDEIIVHTPAQFSDAVEEVIRHAATQAGRLLFGSFPVDFPLSIASVESYADAK